MSSANFLFPSVGNHVRSLSSVVLFGAGVLFFPYTGAAETNDADEDGKFVPIKEEVVKLDAYVSKEVRLDKIESLQQSAFLSPSVVEVLTSEDLTNTGALDLTVALDKLIPSFSWPPSYNSGNSVTDVKSVSLRGTGPAFSLVLINGQRYHRSARPPEQSVDINQIPISAIALIEVVRDGTSTLYGGDAVAGAINIILKEDASGGQINARIGQYSAGDGINRSGNASAGSKLGTDGFVRVSFDFLNKQPTDRSGPNLNQLADGKPQAVNRDRWGDGRVTSHHLWANSEFGITGNLRGYFYGGYGHVDGQSGNQPQRWWTSANDVTRYPDGHQPIADTTTEDITAVAGLKWGTEQTGHFDLSISYGNSLSKDFSYNSVSVSYGPASQTNFFRGSYTNEEYEYSLDWEKALFTGLTHPVTLLSGISYREQTYKNKAGDEQSWNQGPVKIVYDPRNGNPSAAPSGNSGQKGLSIYDLVNIKTNVAGIYAGAETHLTDKLRISGVVRYEDYSDVGAATTVQGSTRYDFNSKLGVRASAGTAFSVPIAAQIGSVGNSIDATTGNWTRRLRPADPLAKALGATELEPATSENFGAGFVYQPWEKLTVSVDGYWLTIDNQIVSTASLSGPIVTNLFTAAGDPTTTAASFYTNGLDTRHRGLEFSAKYNPALPQGAGKLRLSASFIMSDNKVVGIKKRDPAISPIPLLDVISTTESVEESKPKRKLILGANYTLGRWDFAPTVFYYGPTRWYRAPTALLVAPTNIRTYAGAWLVNAQLGFRYSEQLKFTIGLTNLFNKMPEKSVYPNSGLDQYWHTVAYGSAGAFYYTSVDYKF